MDGGSPEAVFETAWALRRHAPAEALEHLAPLRLAAAEDHDAPRWRARAGLLEGTCRWRLDEPGRALKILLDVMGLVPDDDTWAHASVRLNLGNVYRDLADHDTALEHLLDAFERFGAMGDQEGRADALNDLGVLFYSRGELDEAARNFEASLRWRLEVGDETGIAGCRNNLAKVYTGQGRLSDALAHLEAAHHIWERDGVVLGVTMVMNNMGIVHAELGDSERAAALYTETIALKERHGLDYGMSEACRHLGKLEADRGSVDEGRRWLMRAMSIAATHHERQDHLQACLALSELEEAAGDHVAALRWYREFHELERAVFNDAGAQRISALQVAYQLRRAETESRTDPLTGLANRREVDVWFARQRREPDTQVTIALLDVDHFKQVNDRWGHALGDQVLCIIGAVLRDHTRRADLVARYGGEEFLIALGGGTRDDGVRVARALHERIREHPWKAVAEDLAITASLGVAHGPADRGLEPLLEQADRCLYRAKGSGRDRVVAAG